MSSLDKNTLEFLEYDELGLNLKHIWNINKLTDSELIFSGQSEILEISSNTKSVFKQTIGFQR
ncbi:MAG: hypothetical protein LBG77_04600 [Dysgonamonadaceae bacterium]|jgi:hypothetical protein|nr:hypothetical protein [Dysgonamonadaceae bacterium]